MTSNYQTLMHEYMIERANDPQVFVTEDKVNDVLRLSDGTTEIELTEYQALLAIERLADARNAMLDRWAEEDA